MENIEELLRALTEDSPQESAESTPKEAADDAPREQSGGLFDGLDVDMLIKLMGMFESMNRQDDNERFLLALKPLLREENRTKVDSAVKLLKLSAILPILKESGMLGKLF